MVEQQSQAPLRCIVLFTILGQHGPKVAPAGAVRAVLKTLVEAYLT